MSHLWRLDEQGNIDESEDLGRYCNGRVCVLCHYSYCVHCAPDIPPCPGRPTFLVSLRSKPTDATYVVQRKGDAWEWEFLIEGLGWRILSSRRHATRE